MAEIGFWFSLILILHTHLLYPAFLFLVTRRNRTDPPLRHDFGWSVSILFSAYNEEEDIAAKLENLSRLSFPTDRLEVIVGSDGSTDRTVEIIRSFADQNRGLVIRLVESTVRKGKIQTLNVLSKDATGDILVLTDANSMFATDAVEQLVQHFADPEIGLVCGELSYCEPDTNTAGRGESLYWRLEQELKVLESRYNSLVGANGAIYAVRRELFEPLPIWSCDDFETGLQVYQKGYRVMYEPAAKAFERTAGSITGEFRRKTRMIIRQLYSLSRHTVLLHPFRDPMGFQIISHKVLRWFAAHLAILMLVSSAILSGGSPFYSACFTAQAIFYGLALLGLISGTRERRSRLLALPSYFCAMHAAGAVATVQYLLGRRIGIWDPIRRKSGDLHG